MDFEATTQTMLSSGAPGFHLVPTDSADSCQASIGSSEYNQYCNPIHIVGPVKDKDLLLGQLEVHF